MSVFDTYLINLDSSTDRLEEARKQLEAAEISFIRVGAVDGRGVDPNSYDAYDEERALSYMGRKLNGAELGCYLSHLKVAREFLKTDKQYAMVLEDDITLSSRLGEHVNNIISWLESKKIQWDLINIGDRKIKIHTPLLRIRDEDTLHLLTRAHYFSMTTHGLLWSRAGAETFVASGMQIYMPVDNHMREWLTQTDTGLAVWPPLVKASGAESLIDSRVLGKRKTTDRSPLYGFLKQKRQWRNKLRAWSHKLKAKSLSQGEV